MRSLRLVPLYAASCRIMSLPLSSMAFLSPIAVGRLHHNLATSPILEFVPDPRQLSAVTSCEEAETTMTISETSREELRRRLPPVNRRVMTKLEVEFRNLLEGILYTPQEIQSICNPRLRIIYEGVAASYYDPAVYRAFEVLYEDYLPLRVGGRMVYRKLKQAMDESLLYKDQQIKSVVQETGIECEMLETVWETFVQLAKNRRLDTDLLKATIGQETSFLKHFDFEDSIEMVTALDPNGHGFLTFQELMVGLHGYSSSGTCWLNDLAGYRVQSFDREHLTREFPKRDRHNERYDNMLQKFSEWEDLIPSGQGRRLDILHGCFVGARNPKVVDALRVIYVDYSALRVCGDWIFKLVSALIGATKRSTPTIN